MRRTSPRAAVCGALALLGAIWSVPAFAGTLQINPVLVEIGDQRRSGSVTLTNPGSQPITVRGYALAWRQENGEDRHEPTNAMIVSPPIFTIPPGGTQLVRIGPRSPLPGGSAWRLVLEEVPEAVPGTVQVALRLDLPLYSGLTAGRAEDLAWSAERNSDGWTLSASNRGSGYVRIDAQSAGAATGLRFEESMSFGTVLPGSTRRWRIGRDLEMENSSLFQSVTGARSDVATASGRP